jgi:hypothetical protein
MNTIVNRHPPMERAMSINGRFLSILAEAVSKLDALGQVRRDKDGVRHEFEEVLRRYAAKYGIGPDEVRRLSYGYVEDIVDDLFADVEEQLGRAFEEFAAQQETRSELPAPR